MRRNVDRQPVSTRLLAFMIRSPQASFNGGLGGRCRHLHQRHSPGDSAYADTDDDEGGLAEDLTAKIDAAAQAFVGQNLRAGSYRRYAHARRYWTAADGVRIRRLARQ